MSFPDLHIAMRAHVPRTKATYRVEVRNTATGELAVLEIEAGHPDEAQGRALHQQFEEHGWNRCEAAPPTTVDPDAAVADPA